MPDNSASGETPEAGDDPALPWFHPGVLIATGFGLGYLRPAPGTWGSLLGLPLLVGLLALPPAVAVAVWIALLPVGWWACRCGERHFGSHDPGGIVVDEYLAVPLVAAPLAVFFAANGETLTTTLPLLAVVFACFRLFDIWKPGPVGWCDRLDGATGVMADDLAAAVLASVPATALCLLA